jgi:membrane protein YqaA with SNARE-associated domain
VSWLQRRLLLVVGIIMVGLALVGYATVADDFRHVGEFVGVSSLLLGGLALIGDAFNVMANWLVLRWVTVGLLVGLSAGTAVDATLLGFGAGLAAGIAMALWRARHNKLRSHGDAPS